MKNKILKIKNTLVNKFKPDKSNKFEINETIQMEKILVDTGKKYKQIVNNEPLKEVKNAKKYSCVKLVKEVQKELEIRRNALQEGDQTLINEPLIPKMENLENNVINIKRTNKIKTIIIENENELLEFYKSCCNIENMIPDKQTISEVTSLSVSTIKRYNSKLKELNQIFTKGNSIYLNKEVDIDE